MLSVWLGAALSTSQSKWHRQFSAPTCSPVSRGGQNSSHTHQQLCTSWMVQSADGVVTFWAGFPARLVLVYFANLDGLTLNIWRLDDSSLFWDAPFPWPPGSRMPTPRHCPQFGVSIARDVGPPWTCHVCPSWHPFSPCSWHSPTVTSSPCPSLGVFVCLSFSEFGPPPTVASLSLQSLYDTSSRWCNVLRQCWP